jgi:hypothetical protein
MTNIHEKTTKIEECGQQELRPNLAETLFRPKRMMMDEHPGRRRVRGVRQFFQTVGKTTLCAVL